MLRLVMRDSHIASFEGEKNALLGFNVILFMCHHFHHYAAISPHLGPIPFLIG